MIRPGSASDPVSTQEPNKQRNSVRRSPRHCPIRAQHEGCTTASSVEVPSGRQHRRPARDAWFCHGDWLIVPVRTRRHLLSKERHVSDQSHRRSQASAVVLVSGSSGAVNSRGGCRPPAADALNDMSDRLQTTVEDRERQAFHDSLTGLPNRALLERYLLSMLGDPKNMRVGVVMLGLDGFKAIDDGLGRPVGDDVLIAFGERASSRGCSRKSSIG